MESSAIVKNPQIEYTKKLIQLNEKIKNQISRGNRPGTPCKTSKSMSKTGGDRPQPKSSLISDEIIKILFDNKYFTDIKSIESKFENWKNSNPTTQGIIYAYTLKNENPNDGNIWIKIGYTTKSFDERYTKTVRDHIGNTHTVKVKNPAQAETVLFSMFASVKHDRFQMLKDQYNPFYISYLRNTDIVVDDVYHSVFENVFKPSVSKDEVKFLSYAKKTEWFIAKYDDVVKVMDYLGGVTNCTECSVERALYRFKDFGGNAMFCSHNCAREYWVSRKQCIY